MQTVTNILYSFVVSWNTAHVKFLESVNLCEILSKSTGTSPFNLDVIIYIQVRKSDLARLEILSKLNGVVRTKSSVLEIKYFQARKMLKRLA